MRKALESKIREVELKKVLKNLREEVKRSPSLPEGTIVKMIREMREGRRLVE